MSQQRRTTRLGIAAAVVLAVVMGMILVWRGSEHAGPTPTPEAERRAETDITALPVDPSLRGRDASSPPHPDEPAATPDADPTPRGVVSGRVIDEVTGEPIAGARLRSRLERGDVTESIAEAESDAQGRFEIDVNALASLPPLVRATGDVYVLVTADGYHPGSLYVEPRHVSVPDRYRQYDVRLVPGATVRGRVLRPDGTPAVGARIAFVPPGPNALALTRRTIARAEGDFVAGIDSGREYAGRASLAGAGAADLGRLKVRAGEVVDLGDVRLVGPGEIRGVLRYPDGTPASWAKARAWRILSDEAPAHAGLLDSTGKADAQGRFVVRGLAPGSYYVADAAAARGFAPDRVMPGAVFVDTGTREYDVPVAGHRLLIFVKDAEGRPLPGASYLARWGRGARSDLSGGGVDDAQGLLVLRASPGERLTVSARVARSPPSELAVTMEEHVWQIERELVLRSVSDEGGRIRIESLTDEGGAPIRAAILRLRTPLAEATVSDLDEVPLSDDGLLGPVPPGRYVLEVRPGLERRAIPKNCFFPIEQPLEVVANQVTSLALRARSGARLRLTVRGPSAESGRRVRIEAQIHPVDGGDPPSLGAFYGVKEGGGWVMGGLRPDRAGLNHYVLEPGDYELVVRAPGFREHRQPICLTAGRILDVEVKLTPE